MRFTEFFQVLPTLLFSMVIVALFGASLLTVTLAIGVVSWTAVARVTRAEFLRIRELEYVTAARSGSARDGYLIFRVILPNALPPIIVQANLMVGSAILFEAALSFLGLSDPNVMSWGQVIGSNRPYILDAGLRGCHSRLCNIYHGARDLTHRRRPQRRAQSEASRRAMSAVPSEPLLQVDGPGGGLQALAAAIGPGPGPRLA